MTKTKLLSIAVIGLLLINIAIVCFLMFKKTPHLADGRRPMHEKGLPPEKQDRPKNIIIERLQFDKQQEIAYEELIKQHQMVVKSFNDSIKITKKDLYQTLGSVSFAGKDSIINRLVVLQREIELAHYDHFTALKKICKHEQLENFKNLSTELAFLFGAKNNPPRPKD